MATTLMTYAGPAEPDALVTRTGGVPLAPAGTAWPTCAECGGPMQFLAQVLLDDRARPTVRADGRAELVLAVFMCQTDPGMCEAWSATDGANAAFLLPAEGLAPLSAPAVEDEEVLYLGAANAVELTDSSLDDYDGARQEWGRGDGREVLHVLGRLGGRPDWLQGDETPSCGGCGRDMDLVAQFEEGPHHATAMNFGGCGMAYAFACGPCRAAAFLWQC
ncbi:hypothetical protein [Streptomyces chilikensis]|uniref:DUF1963 domain-containing protein n=1 Tax=Streptomyces chilikensis TaxID=1194079 RepID=A0ABV3EM06_9ACTN